MNSPGLFLISLARALVEVALFAMLGQGVLALLAGKNRDRNGVYQLMRMVTRPAVRTVRAITPRFILDRHVPVATFFLLFWLWIGLAIAKRITCAANGFAC